MEKTFTSYVLLVQKELQMADNLLLGMFFTYFLVSVQWYNKNRQPSNVWVESYHSW